MASEEGWGGIADVAAHLSVAKDFPATQGGTAPAFSALGSGRMGEGRR